MIGEPKQNNSPQKAQKPLKTFEKTFPLNILIIY